MDGLKQAVSAIVEQPIFDGARTSARSAHRPLLPTHVMQATSVCARVCVCARAR